MSRCANPGKADEIRRASRRQILFVMKMHAMVACADLPLVSVDTVGSAFDLQRRCGRLSAGRRHPDLELPESTRLAPKNAYS
jgi:hypothetical protein